MRSAIFPRIHGRWKSSRNKERGTFANSDCTQCAHVGAAIPQLVTYVPLVTGGRSHSRNSLSSPPPPPPRRPTAPTFTPISSFGTVDDGSFHPVRHFIRETRRRQRERRRIRLGRTSWPSTFVKLRTVRKYSASPRSSHVLRTSAKD